MCISWLFKACLCEILYARYDCMKQECIDSCGLVIKGREPGDEQKNIQVVNNDYIMVWI